MGALVDALFQFLLALFQQLGRFDLRRNVGHGDDEAVVGHGAEVGGDEAAAAVGQLDAQRQALFHVADPLVDLAAALLWHFGAVTPDLARQVLQPHAGVHAGIGQVQQHGSLGVPCHQLQLGVEHHDALGDVGHGGRQQARLLGHLGQAAGLLQAAEVGDLGDDGHLAAVVGGALADLNPAAVAQQLLELAGLAAVVFVARGDPGIRIGHRLDDDAGLRRRLDHVLEVGAWFQQGRERRKEVVIFAIA